jgi:hypothetical protein
MLTGIFSLFRKRRSINSAVNINISVNNPSRLEPLPNVQKVRLTLDMELKSFDARQQRLLLHALAGFLEVAPESISVTYVEEGSVKVTLTLPTQSADRLLRAYRQQDPGLQSRLATFKPLDVHKIEPTFVQEGMHRKSPSKLVTWEVAAAFSFGVIFIITLIVLAIAFPNPTSFQYTVFRIVLAMSVAGVMAIIPGYIEVRWKQCIQAGGAIAAFVIVYFFSPAHFITTLDMMPPASDIEPLPPKPLDFEAFKLSWHIWGDNPAAVSTSPDEIHLVGPVNVQTDKNYLSHNLVVVAKAEKWAPDTSLGFEIRAPERCSIRVSNGKLIISTSGVDSYEEKIPGWSSLARDFLTFKIGWLDKNVRLYINDQLKLEHSGSDVPNRPLNVRLNAARGDVLVVNKVVVTPSSPPSGKFYIYRDVDYENNNGWWANVFPSEAAEYCLVRFRNFERPGYDNSGTYGQIIFYLKREINGKLIRIPTTLGFVIASDIENWGTCSGRRRLNISGANKLVFYARGEKGDEKIRVKALIAGQEPFGDSETDPFQTDWLSLNQKWQRFEFPITNKNLDSVITPFVLEIQTANYNRDMVKVFVDEIYYEIGQ